MSCAIPAPDPGALTEDRLMDGRLLLRQPAKGHRAGTDAVLVAASLNAVPGERVADFGSGVGSIGLMLARRVPGIMLTLVEIDPVLARLAADNAAANGIAAEVVTSDVAEHSLAAETFDHVAMNPPFHPPGSRVSPDARTARARTAQEGLLARWLEVARRALRPGGVVTLIHRPDALDEILAAMTGFGSGVLVPVHPRADAAAARLLVAAVKAGKGPLVIEPPLILNSSGGRFTPEAEAVHRGAALERAWPRPRPRRGLTPQR
jgi:tRNA1(Val) A37 N6-methylase TrmN6